MKTVEEVRKQINIYLEQREDLMSRLSKKAVDPVKGNYENYSFLIGQLKDGINKILEDTK